jgi:hypothetical protein
MADIVEDDDIVAQERLNDLPILIVPLIYYGLSPKCLTVEGNS